jgi:RNA polymerase primary sigma factor
MGDQLRAGERTIRELVIFNDEEITDERIEERAREVLKQIDACARRRHRVEKRDEKLRGTPKKDREKKKYRAGAVEGAARAGRAVAAHPQDRVHRDPSSGGSSTTSRTQVEAVQRVQREVDNIERQLVAKTRRSPKLKEEDRKILLKRQKELKPTSAA